MEVDLLLAGGITTSFKALLEPEDIRRMGDNRSSLSRLFLQAGYLTFASSPLANPSIKLVVPNEEIKKFALPGLIVGGLLKIETGD